MKLQDFNVSAAERLDALSSSPIRPLYWALEPAAKQLGLSSRTFFELRDKHPFYAPDGYRNLSDDPKKRLPLWSDDLIRLIAFARSVTPQGVRQLSDEEGLKVRKGMSDAKRRDYLAFVDE
jgi:hypothetical protein